MLFYIIYKYVSVINIEFTPTKWVVDDNEWVFFETV